MVFHYYTTVVGRKISKQDLILLLLNDDKFVEQFREDMMFCGGIEVFASKVYKLDEFEPIERVIYDHLDYRIRMKKYDAGFVTSYTSDVNDDQKNGIFILGQEVNIMVPGCRVKTYLSREQVNNYIELEDNNATIHVVQDDEEYFVQYYKCTDRYCDGHTYMNETKSNPTTQQVQDLTGATVLQCIPGDKTDVVSVTEMFNKLGFNTKL